MPRGAYVRTPEIKQKLADAARARTGWHHTDDAKEKISEAGKGRIRSPESIEKTRQSQLGNQHWLGKTHTLETRQILSEKLMGNKNGLGHKPSEKVLNALRARRGEIRTEEQRRKISIALTGRKNPEHSERMLLVWKRPGFKERMLSHLVWAGRLHHKPTKLEIILYQHLNNLYPSMFIETEFPIAGYSVDCAIPELRIAFEADGDYWHQDKEADKGRQSKIENEGWKVIRYSESELLSLGAVQARSDQNLEAVDA